MADLNREQMMELARCKVLADTLDALFGNPRKTVPHRPADDEQEDCGDVHKESQIAALERWYQMEDDRR